MLRVSKMADYATVIMVYLCRRQENWLTAKAIAQDIQLGVPTVSKLLKQLAAAALLKSQLGTKGGYTLAYQPEDISVAQIIAAVEGNSGLTACSYHEGDCAIESVCAIRGNWRLINQAINQALASVSLADLAKPVLPANEVDVSVIRGMLQQGRGL